jgi:hypothetical protein
MKRREILDNSAIIFLTWGKLPSCLQQNNDNWNFQRPDIVTNDHERSVVDGSIQELEMTEMLHVQICSYEKKTDTLLT